MLETQRLRPFFCPWEIVHRAFTLMSDISESTIFTGFVAPSRTFKIRVWSAFIPMWAGFATEEQAAALAGHMADGATFASPFGITTLAKDEKMFDLSVTNNPSNWLGPIWVVANYIAFKGLLRYGYRDQARALCEGTLRLLGRDLAETGSLHEYYDPFSGRPIMNGGFINWNVLALNMARELEE